MAAIEQRTFARLCLAGGLAYCSYAMCRSPVLPLFARQLGAGPELIGFVVAASTITGVIVKLPAGALSDVFGRRALLIAGALVFALLPFAYVPVAALGWVVALRFVHGNATAIFGPVASAAISDLAPADRRGRWLSTYSAVQGAGQAAGALVAGYLMTFGGFDPVFLVSGTLGAGALVLVAWQPRDVHAPSRESWWRRSAAGVREVAGDTRILTISLVHAGQFLVNGPLIAFLPLFGSEILGLSTSQIGLVFAVQTVSTLLARPVFGILSDRYGRRPLIVAGLLASGGAVATIAIATGFPTLLAATCLYGVAVAVTTSGTSAYVTDLARQARYGSAHGIFGTIYDVGDAAGPIVAGLLVAVVGYRQTFLITAGYAVLLALAFLWRSRGWSASGSRRP